MVEVLAEELVEAEVPDLVHILFHLVSRLSVIFLVSEREKPRCQDDESGDAFSPILRVPSDCGEHLRCSLRVADVRNFLLPGLLLNVVEDRWRIKVTHLLKAEFPEGSVSVRIQSLVLSRVPRSPRVPQPYIVPCSSKQKSWRQIAVIRPVICST